MLWLQEPEFDRKRCQLPLIVLLVSCEFMYLVLYMLLLVSCEFTCMYLVLNCSIAHLTYREAFTVDRFWISWNDDQCVGLSRW